MDKKLANKYKLDSVPTPSFVVFEEALESNLSKLKRVMDAAEVKILLAVKSFSMYHSFPLLSQTLSGICASGPYEAKLGRDEFGKEVHVFASAFSEQDIHELAPICDHLVFNSLSQSKRLMGLAKKINPELKIGLRYNPEHSEVEHAIYDPCAPESRLGIKHHQFDDMSLEGISGLHFHTLCENGAGAFERTLDAFENKFSEFFSRIEWVNFGGGHHITQGDYDIDRLINVLNAFNSRYPHLTIYLEPGEAIALNAGVLIALVLDVTGNTDFNHAIVDTSACCHMPDVIEMPYRPYVVGSGEFGEKPYNYQLGGLSCLSGDVIGRYSFDHPLEVGDRLIFTDMAIYSMVKTNTFNGIKLPRIYYCKSDGKLECVKKFNYEDFKRRI